MFDDSNPAAGVPEGASSRVVDAMLLAVVRSVRDLVADGDVDADILGALMLEADEVAGVMGIPGPGPMADLFGVAFRRLVEVAIEHVRSEAPPVASIGGALLNWSYESALRHAGVRLRAGHNLPEIVAEMTGDNPAEIADILEVPSDSPARGDFERTVGNLIEDACWAAAQQHYEARTASHVPVARTGTSAR